VSLIYRSKYTVAVLEVAGVKLRGKGSFEEKSCGESRKVKRERERDAIEKDRSNSSRRSSLVFFGQLVSQQLTAALSKFYTIL
jgi:hypothetical protein